MTPVKIIVILNFFIILSNAQNDGTIVQLAKGKIQGTIRQSEKGSSYWAFQEIPYAAPPVGSNRFQVPKEAEPWNGTLDATKNRKICFQTNSRHDYLEITEDCLYINVYTPIKPGSSDLIPVLLWIHGGGFTAESGIYEYYGPKYIMDSGVVVVTFNYRLGPFGFVGTDDDVIPLNLGLKDQRFAMEWVNENIHLFAGNPDLVTLVGESAGSFAVGYHIISQNPDQNLFRGVIMQSGSPVCVGLKQNNATQMAFILGRAVNKEFSSKNSSELLILLQQADAKVILDSGIVGGVSVEKSGPFSYPGYQAFIDRKYKLVPVIIGFNSEELYFVEKDETLINEIDDNPGILISDRVISDEKNRSQVGSLFKQFYTHNTSFENFYAGYIKLLTDQAFTTGSFKQVELSAAHVPYYLYQFAYKGELGQMMDVIPPDGAERVGHAEDLHYMWDDTTNSDLTQYPIEDQLMLHRYVRMWTNFVKYSNPTPEESDPLLDNIIWLQSNPDNLRYLNINNTFEMREHPRQYQEIKEILEKYIQPPFDSFS